MFTPGSDAVQVASVGGDFLIRGQVGGMAR